MKNKKLLIISLTALAILVLLAVVRISVTAELFKYFLILLAALTVAFLIWKAFIKNGQDELRKTRKHGAELENQIKELKETLDVTKRELDEARHSKLNIVELSPVLHIAVYNVDTSFVRTYVRQREDIVFNGAIRAEICAEYGIRMEDVRFKLDESTNTLMMANFKPGLISYSKKQLNWVLARSYKKKSIFGREFEISDNSTKLYTQSKCDEIRSELEAELDNRDISELEWLSPILKQQVTEMLKLTLGRKGMNVLFCEQDPSEEYVDFQNLRQLVS